MPKQNDKKLGRGDIAEIEWLDTHSTDRLTRPEIESLDEPGSTLAYGVVLSNGNNYLTIACELCLDSLSDGTSVEQIPHGAIRRVRRLGKRDIDWTGAQQ